MRLAENSFARNFKDKYPVITADVSNSEQLNPLLEKIIRDTGDVQNHATNVKADMTHHQMWREDYVGHEQFQIICGVALELALKNAPAKMQPFFKPCITECWGALYKKGDFTRPHDHWPAIWSFSYYVSVSNACSPIVFPGAKLSIKPKNGLMVMFPGWIEHAVPRQKCDFERVMIAGNISQDLDLYDKV